MTAKIKLNAASGGGAFSLQAPSSSANNRVFTLPDIADATMATVNGITEVDEWRITSTHTASGVSTITANWERNDSNFEKIGTGLSESSGVFSFPSTGKYYISFKTSSYGSSTTQYAGVEMMVSINNGGSYTMYAESFDSIEGGSNFYGNSSFQLGLDVTNTSNFKFYFRTSSAQSVNYYGHSDRTATGFTCIRLGDT